MTATDRLLPWLLAQLDADEQKAKAATPGPWSSDPTGTVCADTDLQPDGTGGEILPEGGPMEVAECYRNERAGERGANAEHIAAQDPARVLRLVAAMRRRLERHQPRGEFCTLSDFEVDVGPWPCWEIRNDLLVFADRPGFDPRWASEEGL